MEFNCFNIKYFLKYENKNDSSYIVLPPSALVSVFSTGDIEFPIIYKVKNNKTKCSTFCSVYEFDAEENKCLIPEWVMMQLGLEEGDPVEILHHAEKLDRGEKIIVAPQNENFYNEYNFLEQLENAFLEFIVLNKNDLISIRVNDRVYHLEVVETFPSDTICTINCDLVIDFDNSFLDKKTMLRQSNVYDPQNIDQECISSKDKDSEISSQSQKLTQSQSQQSQSAQSQSQQSQSQQSQSGQSKKFVAFSGKGYTLGKS